MSVDATRWAFATDVADGKVCEAGRVIVVPAVNRRLVLVCLAWHANEKGVAWPSTRVLARETTLSERTLRRVLVSLVEDGLVVRVERPGRVSLYRVGVSARNAARGGS